MQTTFIDGTNIKPLSDITTSFTHQILSPSTTKSSYSYFDTHEGYPYGLHYPSVCKPILDNLPSSVRLSHKLLINKLRKLEPFKELSSHDIVHEAETATLSEYKAAALIVLHQDFQLSNPLFQHIDTLTSSPALPVIIVAFHDDSESSFGRKRAKAVSVLRNSFLDEEHGALFLPFLTPKVTEDGFKNLFAYQNAIIMSLIKLFQPALFITDQIPLRLKSTYIKSLKYYFPEQCYIITNTNKFYPLNHPPPKLPTNEQELKKQRVKIIGSQDSFVSLVLILTKLKSLFYKANLIPLPFNMGALGSSLPINVRAPKEMEPCSSFYLEEMFAGSTGINYNLKNERLFPYMNLYEKYLKGEERSDPASERLLNWSRVNPYFHCWLKK